MRPIPLPLEFGGYVDWLWLTEWRITNRMEFSLYRSEAMLLSRPSLKWSGVSILILPRSSFLKARHQAVKMPKHPHKEGHVRTTQAQSKLPASRQHCLHVHEEVILDLPAVLAASWYHMKQVICRAGHCPHSWPPASWTNKIIVVLGQSVQE